MEVAYVSWSATGSQRKWRWNATCIGNGRSYMLPVRSMGSARLRSSVEESVYEEGALQVRILIDTGSQPIPFRYRVPVDGERRARGVEWNQVLGQLRRKLAWDYPMIEVSWGSFSDCVSQWAGESDHWDLLIALGVQDNVENILPLRQWSTQVPLSKPALAVASGEQVTSVLSQLNGFRLQTWRPNFLRGAKLKDAIQTRDLCANLYARGSVDDLVLAVTMLVTKYVLEKGLTSSLSAGRKEAILMWKKCKQNIINCLLDTNCRNALSCMGRCGVNDQVCTYRCLTQWESPAFEAFSLCILEKNNCLGNFSAIPTTPTPQVLASFRGEPMSQRSAEEIFFGWLNRGEKWSWIAVAGQNPAYDAFPCQHQLWYRENRNLWYDPVFQVELDDGRTVWRRRHYRVRHADEPGTFHFSVCDNGVVSKEFWRILDADEDLSFAIFYYTGAASAAGLSYRGAIVTSRDGCWPNPGCAKTLNRIENSLQRAGIELWEMYATKNRHCSCDTSGSPPPFHLPSKATTERRA